MYFLPTILQIQIASHQKQCLIGTSSILQPPSVATRLRPTSPVPVYTTNLSSSVISWREIVAWRQANTHLVSPANFTNSIFLSQLDKQRSSKFLQIQILQSTKFCIMYVSHQIYRQPVQNAFEKENCPNWLFLYLYCSFKLGKQLE